MSKINEAILAAAQSLPEGALLSPKAYLHLGSRAAIDQALARLARAGNLLRVGRGAYTRPVAGRFGPRPPSTEAIIAAIESSSGEMIVPSGAVEANALGLTTQVPIREVFLTSGANRSLQLGNRIVELKHAARWQLALGNRLAGRVIRALSWLGPEGAESALKTLATHIPATEWEAMRALTATLPSWLARALARGHNHA